MTDVGRSEPINIGIGTSAFRNGEVAFLATVSKTGRPRIRPFVSRIVRGRLVAFIVDSSPKIKDLQNRKQHSIHTLLGTEHEECFLSSETKYCDGETERRDEAAIAMVFATGIDELARLRYGP